MTTPNNPNTVNKRCKECSKDVINSGIYYKKNYFCSLDCIPISERGYSLEVCSHCGVRFFKRYGWHFYNYYCSRQCMDIDPKLKAQIQQEKTREEKKNENNDSLRYKRYTASYGGHGSYK